MTETREVKNKQIAQTMKETFKKRESQVCRVFTVKIQENQLTKIQKEQLKMIFVEAKWLKNSILAWTKENPENKVWNYDTKKKTIIHKDKDMNDIEVELKYIPASVKQCVQAEMISNIRTIISLQKKGLQKGGHLRFVKEVSAVNFKQYGKTHKILSSKRIKLQGVSGSLIVNGLKQFLNENLEYANAKLLNTPKGYYVQFTTYTDKNKIVKKETNKKVLGIDFGCETTFTTSEGEKINATIQESERIKRLSQKLNCRQKKGSKNWWRTIQLLRKEYQKLTNQKNDLANKIIAKFNEYEKIIIQDEQLKNWHKNGHGKAVQHSVLGRVKAKLLENPKTVVLSKSCPTTKLCTKCGEIHDELKVWNRTFKCDCGIEMDRDIHAAKNMVWFYENKVGVERTNIKRVEMKALVDLALECAVGNDESTNC